eukprot:CAMPEP_0172314972 /NCGR_PEP_ID=MMETSP1058-20130122/23699_1 /TAXON_ID=83371 /ORGANISM="Detonula confervacea, Strain CCMP 353" /LENGTH=158 /DNA_ID=CAMNT_0013028941 /DNA_START=35 /DNA_END=508 /DNA_ORIENTATION=+
MKFTAHVTCLVLMPVATMALTTARRHLIVHPKALHYRYRHRLVQFSTLSDSDSDIQTTTSTDTSDAQISKSSNDPNNKNNNKSHPLSPPDPSTFPPWSYEPRDFFRFEILHESKKSLARVGRIHTPHGIIDTPSYVAVATNGALKGVDFRDADKAGQQ